MIRSKGVRAKQGAHDPPMLECLLGITPTETRYIPPDVPPGTGGAISIPKWLRTQSRPKHQRQTLPQDQYDFRGVSTVRVFTSKEYSLKTSEQQVI